MLKSVSGIATLENIQTHIDPILNTEMTANFLLFCSFNLRIAGIGTSKIATSVRSAMMAVAIF